MSVLSEAHEVVRSYSTTWYEPVRSMPPGLNEATTSAYLCMRAIDEIEDHPTLHASSKAALLRGVSKLLQGRFTAGDFVALLHSRSELPEVTQRLGEWATLAPSEIAPRVLETFAAMAERMADWAEAGFAVHTKADLDRYTYTVAGTLVMMLSDLWSWYDGTRSNRTYGVGFGRALQAVNILIDHDVDAKRDVDFWPDQWQQADLVAYCRTELVLADAYVADLPLGPARTFCAEPLARAHRALRVAATTEGKGHTP